MSAKRDAAWLGEIKPGYRGETTGWRSYGPGKFDSIMDRYMYETTLEGGADEEEGNSVEGAGWYGLLRFKKGEAVESAERMAHDENDELTTGEKAELADVVGVILFERTDGIVEVEYYESEKDRDAAWKRVEEAHEEDREGDEDDEDAP